MSLASYTFSQLMTFARASTKWLPGSAGALVQTASGQPAFSYDPVSLAPRGLNLEGASSNIYPYSNAIASAISTNQNNTITAAAGTAPDGTTTATSLVPTTTSGSHFSDVNSPTGGAANIASVFSVYAKANGYTRVGIQLLDLTAPTNGVVASFDLSAGTVLSAANNGAATGASAKITALQNGWYRISVSGIPNNTADALKARVLMLNNTGASSFAGDGISGVLMWGAQIEQTARGVPSSLIVTASSPASRAADICSMTALNPWFLAASGTVFVQARIPNPAPGGANQVLIRFDDGTDSNKLEIRNPAGTSDIEVLIVSGGQTSFQQVGGAFSPGAVVEVAVSYASNAFGISVNGATTITGATGAIPQGISRCILGASDLSGSNALNGELQDINYYPVAMNATDLQALT